jgi:hypothetical protein
MKTPSSQQIRSTLEERRRRHDERVRREEAAMDAFAVEVGQCFTQSVRVVAEDPDPWRLLPADATPVETMPARRANARDAIEERRQRPADSKPTPEPGEPPLRAALRGIVEDYAEPITPSEQIVTDLEERSGISLDEADSYGLWANLELEEVLAVQDAMREVVDIVTDRAEAVIIAELVAAQERVALEYPDAPRPEVADVATTSRGR